MDSYVSKSELLKRLAAGYQGMSDLLTSIDAVSGSESGAVGYWSVRDVVLHLVAHAHRAGLEIEYAKQGIVYPAPPCNDDFNLGAVMLSSYLTYAEALAIWTKSHERVAEIVAALDDADFAEGSAMQQVLDDTIDGALANNTYEHYDEHAPQILEWLARRRHE